ncbi:hypothetical protein PF005_g14328 [Phytophthora fragariae]|nr:hypothetical protein PF003_g14953 [Phytophthora fragariae]KAE9341216.1 hypothetical protein PR003_g10097 [Phytophthora rubi]KAE8931853.1 hypothetical protein PF009_g18096 [Phytophthora fragariae]KAE9001672.1 hypothetical protein PF011_g13639 [Phytophthora fragariae]KAE9101977.1 hypothetical protein PF007_g14928 [Phytophthora fragariae]
MVPGWNFQLVDDGGNALTSADAVPVDIEDVVCQSVSCSPYDVIAADLKVFAVTQEGKHALEEDSSTGSFGGRPMVVQRRMR